MHIMAVNEKYYNMLKSGKKTIELRLFDAKRKDLKINDIIKFCNASNNNDTFKSKVFGLHKANNFEDLCEIINPIDAGFDTKESLLKVLEEFYSIEKQNEIGVIGIEIIKLV